MAHLAKFTRAGAHAVIAHVMRTKECHDNVDPALSHLNRYVSRPDCEFEYTPLADQYEGVLHSVKCMKRPDVKTLCSWVITLPRDIDVKNQGEVDKFFDTAIDFVQKRYPETFIGAGIHFDEPESRPHVHILMVPVVKEKKPVKVVNEEGKLVKTGEMKETGYWKICSNDLYTRSDLQMFHRDLERVEELALGRKVAVYRDGITKQRGGNRTLSQLKLDTARADYLDKQEVLNKQKLAILMATKTLADAQAEQVLQKAEKEGENRADRLFRLRWEQHEKNAQARVQEIQQDAEARAAELVAEAKKQAEEILEKARLETEKKPEKTGTATTTYIGTDGKKHAIRFHPHGTGRGKNR